MMAALISQAGCDKEWRSVNVVCSGKRFITETMNCPSYVIITYEILCSEIWYDEKKRPIGTNVLKENMFWGFKLANSYHHFCKFCRKFGCHAVLESISSKDIFSFMYSDNTFPVAIRSLVIASEQEVNKAYQPKCIAGGGLLCGRAAAPTAA